MLRMAMALVMVSSMVLGLGLATASANTTREDDQAGVVIKTDALGMPEKVFFPETGHNLSGALLKAWNSTGLMIFGYPISEPIVEKGRTVQYFERARLEVWPEHAGTQWEVQGTLLGNWITEKRSNEVPFKPLPTGTVSDDPNRVIFGETNHSLAYGFKEYWDANGGLWQFGFPISEEFVEGGFTVQYFERARFEYHPENADTPYAVLLGHLGRDNATKMKIKVDAAAQDADAVRYDAGLFDSRFEDVFRPTANSWYGYVSTDAVGIRTAPDSAATTVDVLYNRRPVIITGMVRGKQEENTDAWYVVNGGYIAATYIDPLVLRTPEQTFSGHWVDVNLSQFYAVTYNGTTPTYVAVIAAGRDGKTPTGVFNVQAQVRSEIMDSGTLGVGPGQPGYYYLENVEFTQYFLAGGYALHGNYWTAEWAFGGFTTNGCVGLMNADAEYFWWWLNVGDEISIHF